MFNLSASVLRQVRFKRNIDQKEWVTVMNFYQNVLDKQNQISVTCLNLKCIFINPWESSDLVQPHHIIWSKLIVNGKANSANYTIYVHPLNASSANCNWIAVHWYAATRNHDHITHLLHCPLSDLVHMIISSIESPLWLPIITDHTGSGCLHRILLHRPCPWLLLPRHPIDTWTQPGDPSR